MMMQSWITSGSDRLRVRGNSWLEAMVKLKPGVSIARAQADLNLVAADLANAYADDKGRGVKLYELWRSPTGGGPAVTAVMGIQLAVAGVILLIACANVGNLLLARAASRQRETAVRLTLGASRRRLLQQLLTESVLLAGAGGICGVAIAYWTKDLVKLFIPPAPLPIDINPALGTTVLLYALAATAVSVVAFGLAPALQGSSTVASALKESSGSVSSSPRRARLRRALVVAQVALSLVLLVSAGLFLRTLQNAQSVDPGFSARKGIFAAVDLLPAGYDMSRGRAFFRDALVRVRELPGVEAASLTSRLPLGFGGGSDFGATIDGYTPAPNEEITLYYTRVGSDYLKTMGIPLVAGREFDDRDTADRPDVGIINETLARRYFPGRNPIGGRIHTGDRDGRGRRRRSRRQVQQHHRGASPVPVSAGAAVLRAGRGPPGADARQSRRPRAAAARDLPLARHQRAALRRAHDRRAPRDRRVHAAHGREPARRIRRPGAGAGNGRPLRRHRGDCRRSGRPKSACAWRSAPPAATSSR